MNLHNAFLILLFISALSAGAALDKASSAQQTAISELVQSLQSAKKVILTGKRSASSAQSGQNRNIFKDKQKFILPEMPRENNPEEQLQVQIREQRQLLEQMRKAPAADTAAQEQMANKQKEIQENVRKTAGTPSLPPGTAQSLNRAQNAMKESGKMLQSGQPSMAQSAAQKALSDLKQAEKTITDDADRRMRNTLADAQRKLERLSESSRRGTATPQTPDSLRSLSDRLLNDALAQHKTGRQSHAQDLARLAQQIHNAASSREKTHSLANLIAEIRELRLKGKNEQRLLAESAVTLQKLAQELKYTAKHPENSTDSEKRRLRDDLLTELETVDLALGRMEQTGGKTPIATEAAATAKRIASSFADRPEDQAGASVLPPSASALKLAEDIGHLCADIHQLLNRLKTTQNVYRFQPDDVPEKYRKDVAKYFELLSETRPSQQEKPNE